MFQDLFSLSNPGTSDEHITVVENLRHYNPDGAILVTTPQVCIKYLNFYCGLILILSWIPETVYS